MIFTITMLILLSLFSYLGTDGIVNFIIKCLKQSDKTLLTGQFDTAPSEKIASLLINPTDQVGSVLSQNLKSLLSTKQEQST
jgi:hypothetical protein